MAMTFKIEKRGNWVLVTLTEQHTSENCLYVPNFFKNFGPSCTNIVLLGEGAGLDLMMTLFSRSRSQDL